MRPMNRITNTIAVCLMIFCLFFGAACRFYGKDPDGAGFFFRAG